MTEDELDWPPPESRFVDEEVALERIRDLTTTARTTWLVLIGFLAFIGLTLLSVRDVDFFSVSATTDLPIVDIAIPTTTFFWTAALLAAVLHTYFHVFLLKLWDALAEAPAKIDNLTLGDRVFPWLVNDWALRRRTDPNRSVTERPMDWLADAVTFLLIWLATPIVLAGFWWRSMPAHEFWLTLTIAVALAVSLYASFHGWRRATARLRRPGAMDGSDHAEAPISVGWRFGALIVAILLVAITALRTVIPIIRIGPFQPDVFILARANLVDAEIAVEPEDWRDWETARRRFHLQWCTDNGLSAQACESPLGNVSTWAQRRWCLQNGIAAEDCTERFATLDDAFEAEWAIERGAYISNIRGPDLRGRDLRNADARGAFLAGVDLREARLEGADLRGARLERANLFQARLERANLREARLEGADIRRARLKGAELGGAEVEYRLFPMFARREGAFILQWAFKGTDFRGAELDSVFLRGAEPKGADLRGARLEGADLREARLEGADLREARLKGADLGGARLEGTDLRGARLEGADLREARLEGADLGGARLHSAEWAGATIGPSPAHSADFTDGKDLTQNQLELVIGDEATILPRDAETGEPLHVWSCWQEEAASIFIEIWTEGSILLSSFVKAQQELIERGWICGPDNPRRPVGTPAEDVAVGSP